MLSVDERKRRVLLVRLTGCVTYNNAPELRKAIFGLHANEASHIIIDLKRVKNFDSSAIATLVEMQKECLERNVRFTLAGADPILRKWFHPANLDNRLSEIFEVAPSVDDALEREHMPAMFWKAARNERSALERRQIGSLSPAPA